MVSELQQAKAGTSALRVLAWVVPLLLWFYYATPLLSPRVQPSAGLIAATLIPPAIALVLLRVRGRFPVGVALAVGGLLLLSPGVIGAAFVAQASLARRAKSAALMLLSGGWLVAAKLLQLLLSPQGEPWGSAETVELTIAVAGLVIATLLGALARSQAAESQSRADVRRARLEAERARIDQARLAEREQIAREMHDVLAHRLSLVSLHAGALAIREDLPPNEAREAARLIQSNARQSLDELRAVLSSLRGADAPPEPPQPMLAELPVLIADVGAEQRIDLALQVDPGRVAPRVSRHAYRIVQEALTNARKHAPGAPVQVTLTGAPGGRLELRVSNPVADLAVAQPGGFGLLGVAERVAWLGGTVQHGVADGRFTLEVSLPWGDAG